MARDDSIRYRANNIHHAKNIPDDELEAIT